MNMPLVLLNRRRRGNVFTPSGLFALSEPGVWYDPSDLTTLFQDTAGTTPVTTPGQTVALALDKSKGLVLGPEAVINGGFATDTDWTKGSGWTIGGGVASCDGSVQFSQLSQPNVTPLAKYFKVSFTLVSKGASVTNLRVVLGGAFVGQIDVTSAGTYSGYFFNSGGSLTFALQTQAGTGAAFAITIDNISVRELPGFHATQSTAASRPTYGIVPSGGRRNLLTYSEEVDNAAWAKGNLITSGMANAGVAPNGTTTAEKLTPNTTSTTKFANASPNYAAPTGQSVVHSCYVKADGYSKIALRESASTGAYASFDLSLGSVIETGNAGSVVVSNASITAVGSGWFRIAMTCTNASAQQTNGFGAWPLSPSYTTGQPSGQNWIGNGTSGILIWGAQLETGSTATAYQRVGSAFDVTEAGVASLSYLSFDGVDDFLVTPTITPGVDKAQVFAGVRKVSGVGFQALLEYGTGIVENGLAIFAPSNVGPDYDFRLASNARATAASYSPPITNVLAVSHDLAGATAATETFPRINGAAVSFTGSSVASGNFINAPLYIGRRGGTTLPFNGNIFSLVVRFGANLDASTITNTERWVGGKTGVTI